MNALLTELGHEVVVANARRLRLIAEHDTKRDRTDVTGTTVVITNLVRC